PGRGWGAWGPPALALFAVGPVQPYLQPPGPVLGRREAQAGQLDGRQQDVVAGLVVPHVEPRAVTRGVQADRHRGELVLDQGELDAGDPGMAVRGLADTLFPSGLRLARVNGVVHGHLPP